MAKSNKNPIITHTQATRTPLLTLGLLVSLSATSPHAFGADPGRVVCAAADTAGKAVTGLNNQIRFHASAPQPSTSMTAAATPSAEILSAPSLVVTPEGAVIICVTSQTKAH